MKLTFIIYGESYELDVTIGEYFNRLRWEALTRVPYRPKGMTPIEIWEIRDGSGNWISPEDTLKESICGPIYLSPPIGYGG